MLSTRVGAFFCLSKSGRVFTSADPMFQFFEHQRQSRSGPSLGTGRTKFTAEVRRLRKCPGWKGPRTVRLMPIGISSCALVKQSRQCLRRANSNYIINYHYSKRIY